MTALLQERGFAIGYALMLLGVIVLLDGFAVDAWLHAEDPGLAAEEGVFSLENPGHLLVVIGLCLTVIGAAVGPYTRWVLPSRSTMLAVFLPAVVFGFALAGSTAFAIEINSLSHEDEAHSHTEASDAGDPSRQHGVVASEAGDSAAHPEGGHGTSFVLPEHRATVALAESTMHMPANEQPVTAENLAFAEQFLAEARAATEKYEDVAVAEADGYFRITPDLPLIGAHYFHVGYEGLDPARPSILLYHDDGEGPELYGMSYDVPKTLGDDNPPETGFGGLAGWHYHSNLCFTPGGNVLIAPTADACPGQYVPETGWLLHVWAWSDSPEGVFDHANSLLQ